MICTGDIILLNFNLLQCESHRFSIKKLVRYYHLLDKMLLYSKDIFL